MKVEFKASFAKDLRNIKEKNVLECVKISFNQSRKPVLYQIYRI